MKLTIEMTDRDISCGKKGMFSYCPIALATKRAAREAGMQSVPVDVGGPICRLQEYIATMPEECGAFVEEFDSGEDVKPLDTFTLFFVPFDGAEEDYHPGEERDTRYS